MALYRYIGESQVAFEHGSIYEAEKSDDELWKLFSEEFYAVEDESGEWYDYEAAFFEKNFVKVED